MNGDISDFDNWQVYEVSVSDAAGRGSGWANTVRNTAQEHGIPLEMRYDAPNRRYLLALPTDQLYDDLMGHVDAEYTAHFEARMAELRQRYALNSTAVSQNTKIPQPK